MKIYQVGGSVRDSLLGLKSKDIDYAVEASSFSEMKQLLVDLGYHIFLEKEEYLAIRARDPRDGIVYDYTMCRVDGFYTDHRRPDSVTSGTIMEDLRRRDFTINAIAIDPDGEYLDPFDGRSDLETMTLRCVGKTDERIREIHFE